MSAGHAASNLLFTLITASALFFVLAAITFIPVLGRHSYALSVGWQTKASQTAGICDRELTTKGFPLATRRPAAPAEDPSGGHDSTNPLAEWMNLALCFAAAAIVSVAIVSVMRERSII